VTEARLQETEHGLVPDGEGWFVLNALDARWFNGGELGAACVFEGEPRFEQLGMNIGVGQPGQPACMYHWEDDQEDFLVLSGEGVLIVEGEERPLKQWDFFHCPQNTRHVIVAAGTKPCVVLAVGTRTARGRDDWGGYPVDETAAKYGASVERETTSGQEAYARFGEPQSTRYREGWLPNA
jgi:uncharacterized cupin superfamily protein